MLYLRGPWEMESHIRVIILIILIIILITILLIITLLLVLMGGLLFQDPGRQPAPTEEFITHSQVLGNLCVKKTKKKRL